jgi:hypothetical protein
VLPKRDKLPDRDVREIESFFSESSEKSIQKMSGECLIFSEIKIEIKLY